MRADQIETVAIGSWGEFIEHLRTSSYDVADYFYRGQGDPNWSLVPTLQRKLTYPIVNREIYTNRMYEYLRAFRDHAHGLIGFPDGLANLDQLFDPWPASRPRHPATRLDQQPLYRSVFCPWRACGAGS